MGIAKYNLQYSGHDPFVVNRDNQERFSLTLPPNCSLNPSVGFSVVDAQNLLSRAGVPWQAQYCGEMLADTSCGASTASSVHESISCEAADRSSCGASHDACAVGDPSKDSLETVVFRD